MNELIKGLAAIVLYFVLFGVSALSVFTLNPFGILIGVFGIHWLWQNLNKFV